MAAEEKAEARKDAAPAEAPPKASTPPKSGAATPKRSVRTGARRPPSSAPAPAAGETPAKASPKKSEGPKAPRRPVLEPELARLLAIRREVGRRRPKFVRTASHRYWRIGRWESWRAATGIQSKQRRHYGYRPVVVSIGFGSPRRTRGLTPTGFRPVIVHTTAEIERLEKGADAAIIARTVGVRRRLVLEETARKLGIHVLNPIGGPQKEE
ncbi:MAG: 50S ribosomal protein L32e [Thermoplasmata archaeon]|nr:50S ribosomal protein L32e [Thermoplasmata archaeon]